MMRFTKCALVLASLVWACGACQARSIQFSGQTWDVKSGFFGPGPNVFSDAPGDVFVDGSGALHMRIRNDAGTWVATEVISQQDVGYGDYRFEISSNSELFDPQTVVGLFTYLNDLNEIDIELSRWGNPNNPNTAQFVTQPYHNPGNINRFDMNLTAPETTHIFKWRQDSIEFLSYRGHGPEPPAPQDILNQWTYTGADIPPDSSERLRINFWLFQGQAPQNGQDHELIVNSATFTPPPPAGTPGDFDDDGDIDADDIDLLFDNFGGGDPIFDLDMSGSVGNGDADVLIHTILGTEYGDADLNQIVDLNDFNLLAASFGSAGGWADGDFTGNSLVNISDFNELASTFGFDNSGPAETPAVPEPVTGGLMLVMGLASCVSRRRDVSGCRARRD